MPNDPVLGIVARATPVEVEQLLKTTLTADEFSMISIIPHRPEPDPFSSRPSNEFMAVFEAMVVFLGNAAAGGLAWELMKKIYGIISKNYGGKDHKGDGSS